MLPTNHFPANRPFQFFGNPAPGAIFGFGISKSGGVFGRSVSVWNESTASFDTVKQTALLPPPTIIRYTSTPFAGSAGNFAEGGQIEVGKNWQTLALVNVAHNAFGIGNPPDSYDDLTDDDIALAVFMNKFNAHSGNFMPVAKPVTEKSAGNDMAFAVLTGDGNNIFADLAWKMTRLAQDQVRLESFFSDANINDMVNGIGLGLNVDKVALRNAITTAGNASRELFDKKLAKTFEILAHEEARRTYNLFAPKYDIADSPNFARYKQTLTELMEDMLGKAANTLLFGDINQSINTLWDEMWTDDRIFNIGDQTFTMRQMDDRRTFLLSGAHRADYYA